MNHCVLLTRHSFDLFFIDRRDLESTAISFTEEIKKTLRESRFLLVVCSPNSAESRWVNDEIAYCLETHDNDLSLVVPIVLAGRPVMEGETCLPPTLCDERITSRNLPSMIPDEGDPEKTGREIGLVQTLSYLLKVNRDRIKRSIDEEERQQRRRILSIISSALAICICLTVWAMFERSRAERNEQVAIENEQVAIENEKKAEENERQAKEQRDIAVEQENIAKKTLEFMEGVFRTSNPEKGGSKDITVEQVMKNAIPRIELLQPWQLKVSVSQTIGVILRDLGQYDAASPLLEEALRINLQNRPNKMETVESYNALGILFSYTAKYESALKHYKEALKILSQDFNENSHFIASIYNNIGNVLSTQGKTEEAQEYFNKAQNLKLTSIGGSDEIDSDEHPYVKAMKSAVIEDSSNHFVNMGKIYHQEGKYAEVIDFYKKALAVFEQHPSMILDTANCLDNLAVAYSCLGNSQEALVCVQRALKITREYYGEEHPNVALCYSNLGDIYLSMENAEKALLFSEKALALQLKISGENHDRTALYCNKIAEAYRFINDLDNALKYYNRALAIKLNIYGEKHYTTAITYLGIGNIYLQKGDFNRAFENVSKALEIMKLCIDEKHPHIASANVALGDIYSAKGDFENALKCYKFAFNIRSHVFSDKDSRTLLCLENIVLLCLKMAEKDKNIQLFQKNYLPILMKLVSGNDFQKSIVYTMVGVDSIKQKQFQQALDMFQKNLAIHQKILPDDAPVFATNYNNIGKAYYGLKNYSEAEKNIVFFAIYRKRMCKYCVTVS